MNPPMKPVNLFAVEAGQLFACLDDDMLFLKVWDQGVVDLQSNKDFPAKFLDKEDKTWWLAEIVGVDKDGAVLWDLVDVAPQEGSP
jgi:hypothetical protein